jgi:hypothetical protein
MKINCLTCGHSIDIGEAYDDYSGQIRCYVCQSLLEIRTDQGHLKSVKSAALHHGRAHADQMPGGPAH